MQMTVYETRKNNLLNMLEFYENRRAFCEKLGVEYNHLNQYLGKNSKKNIGDKKRGHNCDKYHKTNCINISEHS